MNLLTSEILAKTNVKVGIYCVQILASEILRKIKQILIRWWFQIFLIFTTILGKIFTYFDEHIFQRGWFNHQLVKVFFGIPLTAWIPLVAPFCKNRSQAQLRGFFGFVSVYFP